MFKKQRNQYHKKKRSSINLSFGLILKSLFFCAVAAGIITLSIRIDQLTDIKLDRTIWHIDSAYPIAKLKDELNALAGDELNKNYFDIHLQALKKKLLQHPWVAQVNVERLLLNDIIIAVKTHRILLRVNDDAYLSEKGVFFKPQTMLTVDNPLVISNSDEQDTAKIYEDYQYYNTILKSIDLGISVMEAQKITNLTLTNNLFLKLGYQNQHERLERFAKFYHKFNALENASSYTVDLRYRNGFSLSKTER